MPFDLEKHRKYLYAGVTIKSVDKIPDCEQIAVLIEKAVNEDSGYGDSSRNNYWEYRIFASEDELKGWIETNYNGSDIRRLDFVILRTKPIHPKLSIEIAF